MVEEVPAMERAVPAFAPRRSIMTEEAPVTGQPPFAATSHRHSTMIEEFPVMEKEGSGASLPHPRREFFAPGANFTTIVNTPHSEPQKHAPLVSDPLVNIARSFTVSAEAFRTSADALRASADTLRTRADIRLEKRKNLPPWKTSHGVLARLKTAVGALFRQHAPTNKALQFLLLIFALVFAGSQVVGRPTLPLLKPAQPSLEPAATTSSAKPAATSTPSAFPPPHVLPPLFGGIEQAV